MQVVAIEMFLLSVFLIGLNQAFTLTVEKNMVKI